MESARYDNNSGTAWISQKAAFLATIHFFNSLVTVSTEKIKNNDSRRSELTYHEMFKKLRATIGNSFFINFIFIIIFIFYYDFLVMSSVLLFLSVCPVQFSYVLWLKAADKHFRHWLRLTWTSQKVIPLTWGGPVLSWRWKLWKWKWKRLKKQSSMTIYIFSINLLAFYHKYRALIGYSTHCLFFDK